MIKPHHRAHGILPFIFLAATSLTSATVARGQQLQRPSLVLDITVEGLQTDKLEMLRHRFSPDGFNRLLQNGALFTDIDFGTSLDAVAANTLLHTGAAPVVNGIASATLYEPLTHRAVPVFNSDTPTPADESYSPSRLLCTNLADEIKIEGGGLNHVHSIAPEASMAIAAGGHTPNSVYWINDVSGKWTTSTYYADRPVFLQYRNRMRPVSATLDTLVWRPALPIAEYVDLPETARLYPFSVRFPYGEANRYSKYKLSPAVNAEITEVAIEYLRNLELGKQHQPDMLSVAYSLQPFNSPNPADQKIQQQDAYIRLDRDLSALLTAVEQGPGLENTLILVAGTPLMPLTRKDDDKWRLPSGEFSPRKAISLLNLYLINKFGNGEWVTGFHDGYFYLNPNTASEHHADIGEVRAESARFLRRMSGVTEAYTIDEVLEGKTHPDGASAARNTRHDSAGDIRLTVAPGWVIATDDANDSSTAMSQRVATTTAPAIIMATGIAPQTIATPVDARSIAPTVASILRIRPPNGAALPPIRLKTQANQYQSDNQK